MKRWFCTVVMVGACGVVKHPPAEVPDAPEPPPDVEPDVPQPKSCSPTAPLQIALVDHINSSIREERVVLTANELELYVTRSNPDSFGTFNILRSTRATATSDWSSPVLVDSLNTNSNQQADALSADGRSIYVTVQDPSSQLAVATRPNAATEFGVPAPLANVNLATKEERWPSLDPDELDINFWSDRDDTGGKLYRATRASTSLAFGAPVAVDAPASMYSPVMSADGLSLYYYILTNGETRVSTRATIGDSFGEGALLEGLGGWITWVSPDQCHLYFTVERPDGVGDLDIYLASREPE